MNLTIKETAYQSVCRAMDNFYDALNEIFIGDTAPMEAIWSHADDVSYISPSGRIRTGWSEVLEDWIAQAKLMLRGQIEPEDYHIIFSKNLALVINDAVGENFDSNGVKQEVFLRATHALRKENGKWKMIGAHTELLPFLVE